MVDDGTFAGAAAKEIEEELGLTIPESDLINLTELAIPSPPESSSTKTERLPRAVFPSAGGCDEYIPIFMHVHRVPREQLQEWTGRLTGLREQGEKITLRLVPLKALWREAARDVKALSAWSLYSGLRAEGKI
jgi:ADP-sugar diphosphatase